MPAEDRGTTTFSPEVRRALPVLLAQRLVLNTGGRMALTYLPALAAGTGLTIEGMSRALFARDIVGVAGPAVGRQIGRRGHWPIMTLTGATAAGAMVLLLLGPIGVGIAMVLWGLSRTAFLVASTAWIGDVVAYARRGRASGLVEATWAASALIGLPISGLLIGLIGWWAAPLTLAAIGAPLAAWSARMGTGGRAGAAAPAPTIGTLRPRSTTVVALGGLATMMASAQFLFFSHGLWLSETYDFDATQVGFAIVVVGLAEASASLATFRITDGIGKRRAVLIGCGLLGSAQLVLALAPTPPLPIGLGLLVVAFLGSEFAIVSALPLTSELEPGNRSAVIGLSTGISTATRALVTLLAGWLFVTEGFATTMTFGAATAAVALVVLGLGVVEPAG